MLAMTFNITWIYASPPPRMMEYLCSARQKNRRVYGSGHMFQVNDKINAVG